RGSAYAPCVARTPRFRARPSGSPPFGRGHGDASQLRDVDLMSVVLRGRWQRCRVRSRELTLAPHVDT
ncbi:MAG: hypothetical protein ACPIOQ_44220, partial [Promethearchaeia archaeon]